MEPRVEFLDTTHCVVLLRAGAMLSCEVKCCDNFYLYTLSLQAELQGRRVASLKAESKQNPDGEAAKQVRYPPRTRHT